MDPRVRIRWEYLRIRIIAKKSSLSVLRILIRISMDLHHFGNLDPPPRQIKIRIRINLQMTSQYGKRKVPI
jgi:hypothetical protein